MIRTGYVCEEIAYITDSGTCQRLPIYPSNWSFSWSTNLSPPHFDLLFCPASFIFLKYGLIKLVFLFEICITWAHMWLTIFVLQFFISLLSFSLYSIWNVQVFLVVKYILNSLSYCITDPLHFSHSHSVYFFSWLQIRFFWLHSFIAEVRFALYVY